MYCYILLRDFENCHHFLFSLSLKLGFVGKKPHEFAPGTKVSKIFVMKK